MPFKTFKWKEECVKNDDDDEFRIVLSFKEWRESSLGASTILVVVA